MTTPIPVYLRRLKGFRMPPNTISVARPSKWGNPYKVEAEYRAEGIFLPAITREMAVALFRQRWLDALSRGPAAREALEQLRGKNLACYCPLPAPGQPDLCHRSVLLELANAP
jgi:hypothetical protein